MPISSRFFLRLNRPPLRPEHGPEQLVAGRHVAGWALLAAALALPASAAAQPPPPARQPPPAAQPPAAQPPPAQPPPAQPPPAAQPPAPQPQPGESLIPPAPVGRPQVPGPAAPPTRPADKDVKAAKPAAEKPGSGSEIGAKPSDVFAEDWWSQARPVFEIHGYYRVRAELFHHFDLGRRDSVDGPRALPLWPTPADNDLDLTRTSQRVRLCGDIPSTRGAQLEACENNTQAGANMRFRINPELHISDNLRVLAQIDMLDNVVLGSTPEGYSNLPGVSAASGTSAGYSVKGRGGTTPFGAFASTQWAPVAGVNSTQDSVVVKRVWGEFMTPLGLLRFGRMPSHWGLGMLANDGNGYDSDWQSTSDRIMFVTGIKKYDIYFAGAWDFANEGATSASIGQQQGQAYDIAQLDDVNQYVLVAVRRRNPELQKLELAKGEVVLNGGLYFVFRNQVLANDQTGGGVDQSIGQPSENVSRGYVRRGAKVYIPDLWFQFLYKKFRFEAEAALVLGEIDSIQFNGSPFDYNNKLDPNKNGYQIRQFGLATQAEFRAIEDRLRIHFGAGYATGDPDVKALTPGDEGLQPQVTGNRTYSQFRFHPDYRVDLILWRNILQRVQGAYYFRPGVDYDFARDKNGQKLGGGAAVIWSRASEFIQTPGHARDLGIELNFQLYFQSRDGTLNDDPDKMGGFFTMLQYGVLFPLSGLGYLPNEVTRYDTGIGATTGTTLDTSAAQTLRWYMGVFF
jgi:uncharacterized protein (TIGR04551 family)